MAPYPEIGDAKFIRGLCTFKARSHLATMIQIFDVVTMSSEMGCIVTNVTVHT